MDNFTHADVAHVAVTQDPLSVPTCPTPRYRHPNNRFWCGGPIFQLLLLLLFVHHRGVVRLPFSIGTLERASRRLAVLRDHAAARDVVLSTILLLCESECVRVYLLDGDGVIWGSGNGIFLTIVLCGVAGVDGSAVSPFAGTGYFHPAIGCFPCGGETLDRSRGTEFRFLHIQFPGPEGIVSGKRYYGCDRYTENELCQNVSHSSFLFPFSPSSFELCVGG